MAPSTGSHIKRVEREEIVRSISTTSTQHSRHDTSLEWCSYGPTNTTGRRSVRYSVSSSSSFRLKYPESCFARGVLRRRREVYAEYLVQSVNGCSGTCTNGNDLVLIAGVDQSLDGGFSCVQPIAGDNSSGIVLGVGVAVVRKGVLHVVFDKTNAAPRCGVVGIGHHAIAEWRVYCGPSANDLTPNIVPEVWLAVRRR